MAHIQIGKYKGYPKFLSKIISTTSFFLSVCAILLWRHYTILIELKSRDFQNVNDVIVRKITF